MNKNRCLLLVFLTLLCLPLLAYGQQTATEIKALQPEVQTAEWAVKWWMPRHEQKLTDLAEMKTVDLLMIGDSITHGWETGGKAVWEKYYGKRNALNIGFSGDRTEQVLWRFDHGAIDGISPKAAVVMIGTNNTGHRQDDPDETAAGIKAILDQLGKKSPKTKVLLLAIFPRGASADDELRRINDQINERISKFADNKRIFYLDVSDKFLEADGTLPKSIMPDRLHPNAEGYEIWARAMEPTLAKLMDEK
ncbi:MAG: acetylglucosamine-6-sulfatase [Planctomycetaceae bacterium]|nr:acetylglucosamine-6-sulfatase [Planctomycetaceae bacterium]